MSKQNDPETRKVQLTGGSTYTVSLPKDWAATQDISPGSMVNLYTAQDQLVITNENSVQNQDHVVIDTHNRGGDDIARRIVAAYVSGAEEITISGSCDHGEKRKIRNTITGLVGIEIHEETEEIMVARTMLDTDNISVQQTLTQMKLTAVSMHNAATTAVLTNNSEEPRHIRRQDDDIDRLFRLVCREFQQTLCDMSVAAETDRLSMFDYYTVARQIERIGDHAEKIAAVADRMSDPPPEDVAEQLDTLSTRSRHIVDMAVSGVLDEDSDVELGDVISDANSVTADAESLDRDLYEKDITDSYLLATVLDSIVRTAEYGANIADAGLQFRMRHAKER
ncbi:phosphate uptake regulator PhoU [Salinarchaeum sp. IM2453]|uniref:phosphate signaling complex PhoU family protein n=1 Tax=Salinarchaeum sp. IM2453 TaxID=2862870 RepID=UPI001C83B3AB|nr:phosphate uptake regulator PhoU [Salinarchaeum sp. IM2453]QZA89378.1 phosphate uptake regulator PhoU [Salinarchaeum sp. IM2453]